MQSLLVLVLSLLAVLASACSPGEPSEQQADPAAALADVDVLAAREAVADCLDPLHDSDGSGGFFEFCERVDEIKAADRLNCIVVTTNVERSNDCAEWELSPAQVPPQYFDATPVPTDPDAPDSAEFAPAAQVDLVQPDAITGLPAELKILAWDEFGGCDLIGLCRSYAVFGDGRVTMSQEEQVVATGAVDVALVVALVESAEVDTTALVASLEPGPCEAANDGISHRIWIGPADLELDTCEVDISGDDPLLVAVQQLGLAAEQATFIE